MNIDDLKLELPNLHGLEVSDKELFTYVEEKETPSSMESKAEEQTKDRLYNHILNSDTLEKLNDVESILHSSGYGDEFMDLVDFRKSELDRLVTSFDNYLFHPHSVGKIMGGIPKPLTEKQEDMYNDYTNRKNGVGRPLTDNQLSEWGSLYKRKNEKLKLSDSAKKELDKLFWRETTGRSKRIQAKQLDKGIICEDKTIVLYEDVVGGVFVKNKKRKTNAWFNGECDNSQGKIRDVKTSWEFETFPANEDKIPSKDYEWQLDAYMDLWTLKESELIYGLVDTPFQMITDELYKLDRKLDVFNHEGNVRNDKIDLVIETILSHIYTRKGLIDFCEQDENIHLKWFNGKFVEIPKEKRLKIYNHNYSKERNKQLKDMIVLAREYMNSLLK